MKLITLDTKNTTYQIGVSELGYVHHLYYGPRARGDMSVLLTRRDRGFSGNPYESGHDRAYSMDVLPMEYPCYGCGDYRSAAFNMRTEGGVFGADLKYKNHRILPGKYGIPGLPAVHAAPPPAQVCAHPECGSAFAAAVRSVGAADVKPADAAAVRSVDAAAVRSVDAAAVRSVGAADEKPADAASGAWTLELTMEDEATGVEVVLNYGVLPKLDVITRSVIVKNGGAAPVYLNKVYSAALDFMDGDYELLHFYGRHAMERMAERSPLIHGRLSFGSFRGASSHQHNPFVVLARPETTEEHGSCWGISLLYSGNFKCEAENDQYGQTRLLMGLADDMLDYEVEPGGIFYGPEAVLAYTQKGLSELSHIYHRLIRRHVCRDPYATARRPVLINNWEATYFNFTGEKIIGIARQAAELGVELMVLDDGWFGHRSDDNSSLGDWFVNEEKLGMALEQVSQKVHELGMKFGLWIEPEMVSEDSCLYRTHPDYAFKIPGRKPVLSRNQLVLDFSRPEVVDCIFDQICQVLDRVPVEYIKMDMNRSISDVYTAVSGRQNFGEIMHRYVLGVYDFLERLRNRYPKLLIEGCSGGGGRFDAGMLYYTPQIWCSDNTDAIDRTMIQHGTSFGYPVSAVGSHVSAAPNHQTGRVTPLKTRTVVAMAGSFGYELDLNTLSEDEKRQVKKDVENYKKYWPLIHDGDYYRLHDPAAKPAAAAWAFVSPDKKEALLNIVALESHRNAPPAYVRMRGLDPERWYGIQAADGAILAGARESDAMQSAAGARESDAMQSAAGARGSDAAQSTAEAWEAGGVRRAAALVVSGSALMHVGLPLSVNLGEYESVQYYLSAVDDDAQRR